MTVTRLPFRGRDVIQPRVGLPMSVMFATSIGRAYNGRIVAHLPAVCCRRIVLVRLAVEDGPRADDFRAPWVAARPTEQEWPAIMEYSKMLQQACFPLEATPPEQSVDPLAR